MVNKSIQSIQYQAKRPVSVERTGHDSLIIEGIEFSGDIFRTFFAHPEPNTLYAIRRDGDQVTLTNIINVDEAKKFFEEVEHAL